jgi:hypothetical protein
MVLFYSSATVCAPQVRGFGHVGFLADDLEAACVDLEDSGVLFKKKPAEGNMRGEHTLHCTACDI